MVALAGDSNDGAHGTGNWHQLYQTLKCLKVMEAAHNLTSSSSQSWDIPRVGQIRKEKQNTRPGYRVPSCDQTWVIDPQKACLRSPAFPWLSLLLHQQRHEESVKKVCEAVKGAGSAVRRSSLQVFTWPVTGCMASGDTVNLCRSQFPHLQMELWPEHTWVTLWSRCLLPNSICTAPHRPQMRKKRSWTPRLNEFDPSPKHLWTLVGVSPQGKGWTGLLPQEGRNTSTSCL